MASQIDEHFPLLEQVDLCIFDLIGHPLYHFSHKFAMPVVIRRIPHFSPSNVDLMVSYGDGEIEFLTLLNAGQMGLADLEHWRLYIDELGLGELLRGHDDGSTYRFLVNLAFQYHFCTILLYMGLFDPIKKDLQRLLDPDDFCKINKRILKSRNKFAHGNILTESDYLGRKDFEFLAGVVSTHRSSIFSARSKPTSVPLLGEPLTRLSLGQLSARDFRDWCEHLKKLGLCELRGYRDGKRLLRYLIDLAFQYHLCTILLYMSLFDPIDNAKQQKMLTALEIQKVDRIRKARNLFAHGRSLERHLTKRDFKFIAILFQKHKKTFLAAAQIRRAKVMQRSKSEKRSRRAGCC